MRALTISAHGEFDQLQLLHDMPVPLLEGADAVRVRLKAAALNHLDLFMIAGLPHITIRPPWIVGSDGAGIVEEVGPGVTAVQPGDHVLINPGLSCGLCEYCTTGDNPLCLQFGILGEHHPGTLCESIVLPAKNLARIPRDVPWPEAAAYTLATLTAWRMVVGRAKVRLGEHVLIWGVGGGVALAALRICKQIGARVCVTSSSDAKLERATAAGADEVLNYVRTDVAREIRAMTSKRGVDVVIDNVGQAAWKSSLGALGKRGRLVTCGATSGPLVETDARRLFWNQWTIMGSTMGSDAEFATVAGELAAGRLRPIVDSVHQLGDGRGAYERLAGGHQFGKVVVEIG